MAVETLLSEILAELRGGKGPSKSRGLIDPKTGAPLPPSPQAQAAAQAAKETADAAERELAARERIAASADKARIAAERNLAAIEDALGVTAKLRDEEEDAVKRQRLEVDYAKEQLRLAQELFKIAQAETQVDKSKQKAQDEALANMTKARKEVARQTKEYEKTADQARKAARYTEDIANALGPAFARARRVSEYFKEMSGSGQQVESLVKEVGKNLRVVGKAVGPLLPGVVALTASTALLRKFWTTTKGLVLSADQLRSQFVAITGETGAVRMAFLDLSMSNLDLAISFEKAFEAQLALREGFDGFLLQTPAVKASLTLHAATMERLGVNNQTTAENLTTLTKAFGMSTTKARAMQREMVGLARALELPVGAMMDRFAKAMPMLAEFGDRAEEVFRRLTIASRETGLSVDAITSTFGDALNSYEASTKVAGQLNQVLGAGVISGTELLMADTEERFRIVQDALELTGRSFNDLGRWEKISFAQAAGFNTVNEAARAFNNTQDDIATRIGDTAISQERMNELVVEATDSMTQLKFAMLSFAVALKPAIEVFTQFMDEFVKKSEEMEGGLAGRLSRIVGRIGVVASAITAIIALATSPALFSVAGMSLLAGGVMSAFTAAVGYGGAMAAGVDDFIYQGDGTAAGKITPINSEDQFLGFKARGDIDNAIAAGQGSGGLPAATAAAIGAAVREAVSPLLAAAGRPGGTGAGPVEFVLRADTRELGRFIKQESMDGVLDPFAAS